MKTSALSPNDARRLKELHASPPKSQNAGASTDLVNSTWILRVQEREHRASLMDAIGSGSLHLARVSLSLIDPKAPDLQGETFLMRACYLDRLDMVELLLPASDIDAVDIYGATALWHATQLGHVEVANALLRNGANAKIRSSTGMSPLMQACRVDSEPLVHTLLPHSDTAARDAAGFTALMLAAGFFGSPKLVHALALASDLSALDFKYGLTAEVLAESHNRPENAAVLRVLREKSELDKIGVQTPPRSKRAPL